MPSFAYALQRFYITSPSFPLLNPCTEQRICQCECFNSSLPSFIRPKNGDWLGNKRITYLPHLPYSNTLPMLPRIHQTLTTATTTSFSHSPPQANVYPVLVQSSLPMSWEGFIPLDNPRRDLVYLFSFNSCYLAIQLNQKKES